VKVKECAHLRKCVGYLFSGGCFSIVAPRERSKVQFIVIGRSDPLSPIQIQKMFKLHHDEVDAALSIADLCVSEQILNYLGDVAHQGVVISDAKNTVTIHAPLRASNGGAGSEASAFCAAQCRRDWVSPKSC
jgi:hypothetical protein